MSIDIEKVCAETPDVRHGVHMLASDAALMPQPILPAITDHLQLEAEIGGYEVHHAKATALDSVYDSIARLVGTKRGETALLQSATAA